MAHITFQTALILIFKCAAVLCLSGISTKLALTQAESTYWKANIAFKIQEHFTASYQQYSTEQFISFLMDTNIGLFGLASTNILVHTTFRTIYTMKILKSRCKERIFCSHLVVTYLHFINFQAEALVWSCTALPRKCEEGMLSMKRGKITTAQMY